MHPLELIERVGRTCYKSDSEYTKESRERFFKQLVDRKHFAVLEHAVFIFTVPVKNPRKLNTPYVRPFVKVTSMAKNYYEIISANLRAIKEQKLISLMFALLEVYPELNYYFGINQPQPPVLFAPKLVDFKSLEGIPERFEHLYTTFRFTCDRGVSHELVRHRMASFAQESTRYCNYSKDRFNNEITCIKPAFYDSKWSDKEKSIYENALKQAELNYFMLIDSGISPQEARGVLPTNLKTEVVMTADDKEWKHFFELRNLGITGTPHPNMKKVANDAEQLYYERKL